MPMTDLPRRMAISPPRLDDPGLDMEALLDSWLAWHRGLDRGQALVVQVRTRRLSAATLVRLIEALRDGGQYDLLVVSGRVDIALATGCDGVQLPEAGLPADRVRKLVGDRLRIGRSVHDPDSVREAADAGVDWVTLAPIFPPLSKPTHTAALGVEVLAEAAGFGVPVFALGGITSDNEADCLERGAYGIAAISHFDPQTREAGDEAESSL